MPDVPTFRESGVQTSDVVSWYSLMAPARTPKPIIDKLNVEVGAILHRPEIVERLVGAGLEDSPSTPQQLGEIIRADLARWKQVIQDAKVQMTDQ